MSSVGYCFDVGNATRIALGIWEGVFEEKGEGVGVGDNVVLQEGQRLIDRALMHKVFEHAILALNPRHNFR